MEILAVLLLVSMFLMFAWVGTFRFVSRKNMIGYWLMLLVAVVSVSYFAFRVEHYFLPVTGFAWVVIAWVRDWPKTKRVFGLKP